MTTYLLALVDDGEVDGYWDGDSFLGTAATAVRIEATADRPLTIPADCPAAFVDPATWDDEGYQLVTVGPQLWFDAAVAEYEDGVFESDVHHLAELRDEFDPDQPGVLLVQKNIKYGGTWLVNTATLDDAMHYGESDEFGDEWRVEDLIDLATGKRYEAEPTTTWTYKEITTP